MSQIPQFEGNSFKSRREADMVVPKMKPVVSEKPVVGKKKWRLIDCFYTPSDKSLKEYVVQDLIIPNVKRATGTVLHGIVTKIFGVGPGSGNLFRAVNDWGYGVRGEPYVEYSARAKSTSREQQPQPNVSTDLESYALRSREDAERVLEGLDAYLETYDAVPVSAFFELIGITAPYTYHDFGWTNLSDAKVIITENGYSIRFPKPIRIK